MEKKADRGTGTSPRFCRPVGHRWGQICTGDFLCPLEKVMTRRGYLVML